MRTEILPDIYLRQDFRNAVAEMCMSVVVADTADCVRINGLDAAAVRADGVRCVVIRHDEDDVWTLRRIRRRPLNHVTGAHHPAGKGQNSNKRSRFQ